MVGHEVLAGRRDQDRELLQELERLEEEVSGPVIEGVLELVREPPVGGAGEPREGEGRAQPVAGETFEAEPVMGGDGDAGVYVEPLHLRAESGGRSLRGRITPVPSRRTFFPARGPNATPPNSAAPWAASSAGVSESQGSRASPRRSSRPRTRAATWAASCATSFDVGGRTG